MIEHYYQIQKINLKHNMFPHIAAGAVCLLISPFIIGMKNLDSYQTAKVMEIFFSLFGILFFVPVFMPDVNDSFRELIASKKESMESLLFMRFLTSLFLTAAVLLGFLTVLHFGNCEFSFYQVFYGGMANCLFLGGMGMLFFSLFNHMALAYMMPVLYYLLCYGGGKKYLGNFYLFSMMWGSFQEKKFIMAGAGIMIFLAIGYRGWKRELG
ncbi:MAG: hypothetical protein NC412_14605 [Roseburia sp.]|nr:hypothetical protein [Roseburia sp.]MCM1279964.1 hypothetical protein [Robinsoniella sp.]